MSRSFSESDPGATSRFETFVRVRNCDIDALGHTNNAAYVNFIEQPARLTNPAADALPRAYVHCTAGPLAPSFAPFAERLRASPGWGYRELATGHDAMLSAPEELAEVLLDLRRDQGAGARYAKRLTET